ncbi:hypothetical protein COU20_02715 [Candidatus Kaiserbacteria bacterium CG10_big_fil_rev_8_21_14_0_10_59_10]|uniref:Phage shock protein PspC N-terminal domain-containing protein n=1 Tax=Candidatus Kaiserbacteria bacterium CG10_big_fil_rev_8_21_14_0_10_59_10 TaxID=1974612 RepID=A0A2H0U7L9_9BACT|nr:MAG: hypothetical protein COU20_02715 [Candidatus Kaiserbacteria bacterium CG10_big_fil_rev_8_21_14_0_10_59_10]
MNSVGKKRLRRNRREGTFAGVLAGLADYFDIDVTLLRVLFIFFVIFTGVFPGVIAYLLAILVMPSDGGPTVHTPPAGGSAAS